MTAILKWLWGYARPALPYLAVIALLIGAYLWIDHHGFERGARSRDGEVAALKVTIAHLKAASAQAKADNLAHVRAEEQRQDKITKEQSDAQDRRVASLRADYDRRLREYREAHPGAGGAAGLPEVPDPAVKFDGASCRDGLLCIPAEQAFALMRAADENTQQLIGLQDWVRQQGEGR